MSEEKKMIRLKLNEVPLTKGEAVIIFFFSFILGIILWFLLSINVVNLTDFQKNTKIQILAISMLLFSGLIFLISKKESYTNRFLDVISKPLVLFRINQYNNFINNFEKEKTGVRYYSVNFENYKYSLEEIFLYNKFDDVKNKNHVFFGEITKSMIPISYIKHKVLEKLSIQETNRIFMKNKEEFIKYNFIFEKEYLFENDEKEIIQSAFDELFENISNSNDETVLDESLENGLYDITTQAEELRLKKLMERQVENGTSKIRGFRKKI